MKFGIDLSQPSTIRGILWILSGVAGIYLAIKNNNIEMLTVFLPFILNGTAGVAIKDKEQ